MSGMTYEYITSPADAQAAIDSITSNWVAIDIETAKMPEYAGHKSAGLSPHLSTIRLVQLCEPNRPDHVHIIDVWACGLEAVTGLVNTKKLVAHNGKFEESFFRHNGMEPLHINCTMIMAHVLAYPKTSLADMLRQVFNYEMSKEQQKSEWGMKALTEAQLDYAADDAFYLVKLAQHLSNELSAKKLQPAYTRFHKAQSVMVEMELKGIPFDAEEHRGLIDEWETAKEGEWRDINPKSGKQMDAFFRETVKKGIISKWPVSEKTKLLKLDADTLLQRKDSHPVIEPLLKWKMYEKLTSTYGTSIQKLINPVTNRLHPSFRIFGARTGRFSSNQPNMQNPPREAGLREMVKAPPGYVLMDADYGQVELRIAAVMAQDVKMLRAYQEGKDLHKITAASIAGISEDEVTKDHRQQAKAVNFGLIYGAGPKTLKDYAKATYGVEMTLAEAKAAKEAFLKTYPQLSQWQKNQSTHAAAYMYAETTSGYRRQFVKEGLTSRSVYTVSMNTPVQGTGAEILIEALADLHANLHKFDGAQILAHIHDEILLMVKEEEAEEMAKQLEASMIAGYKAVLPDAPDTDLIEVCAGPIWEKAMPLYEPGQGGDNPDDTDPSGSEPNGGGEKDEHKSMPISEPEVSETDIANAFREYQKMGYSLVAFNQDKKGPSSDPKYVNWHNNPTTELPSSEVNIGLIHGLSRTVSLDADDLEKTRIALGGFGIDLDAITANAPTWYGNPENRRKYLFKMPTSKQSLGVKQLQAHGKVVFEIRGTTNGAAVQDVLPPSIHPDTKRPYQWETPLVPVDQLPELPNELLQIWTDWEHAAPGLMSMLGDITKTKTPSSANADTLELIDTFNAKYPVTDWLEAHGYEAARRPNAYLCPESSTGLAGVIYFPEDNLVFSHHGSDRLNAEESGHPHDSFDCFRILEHDGDWRLAFEDAAERLGMELHYSEPPSEAETKEVEESSSHTDFPNHLLKLPGMIAPAIYEFILESSPRPQPVLALGATLATLSASIRNMYESRSGLRGNLQVVLIGDTGSGKNAPLRAASRLLMSPTNPIIQTGKPASGAGLHQILSNNPQLFMSTDEFGLFLKALLHEKASPAVKQAVDLLVELFTASDSHLPSKAYANAKDSLDQVDYPYLSLLGATTPDGLYDSIGEQQIKDGTFNRFLFFETTDFVPFDEGYKKPKVPVLIRDWLGKVSFGPSDPEHPYGTASVEEPYQVPQDDKARALLNQFARKADSHVRDGDSKHKAIWVRANEMANKLAMLLAISIDKDNPIVDEECATWAVQFMEYQITFMAESLADGATSNDHVKLKDDIYRLLADARSLTSDRGNNQLYLDIGGIPYGLINHKFRSVEGWKLKNILKEMVESEEIGVVKGDQIEAVRKHKNYKSTKKVPDVYYPLTGVKVRKRG